MKTLYYCFGGGLGHFTRFVAWCHTTGEKPVLLTNCPAATDSRLLPAGVTCLMPEQSAVNKDGLRAWLKEQLLEQRPDRLIIDAFPGGIFGELCEMPELGAIECVYLARILQLEKYLQRTDQLKLPTISSIFELEKLKPEHRDFNRQLCSKISKVELIDPPARMVEHIARQLPAEFSLILHSGPDNEVEELCRYAIETSEIRGSAPHFVVVSSGNRPAVCPPTAIHFNLWPAGWLIEKANSVFSGAGFNIIRQMQGTKKPHYVMPFARALDDQFFRFASSR
ncbi:MAG TPA: hypothetical protein PKN29_04765 [Candidatus Ozemobacteraceae bacterium]|nr:hypothetical protein [Candidatus Ozemobacteraceae bacterium]